MTRPSTRPWATTDRCTRPSPSMHLTLPTRTNSVQQYGGQGVYMVDGGRAPFASLNDNAAIIDSVKTLPVIDVDLALYMPINIDIAVNSSTPQYTASMGGDEPLDGNFTVPIQGDEFRRSRSAHLQCIRP